MGAFLAPVVVSPLLAQSSAASTDQGASFTDALRIAKRYRVDGLDSRRFTHDTFGRVGAPSLKSPVLHTEEIGKAMQGR
jgi:hypothetical protein